jgi:hypothetical protein
MLGGGAEIIGYDAETYAFERTFFNSLASSRPKTLTLETGPGSGKASGREDLGIQRRWEAAHDTSPR